MIILQELLLPKGLSVAVFSFGDFKVVCSTLEEAGDKKIIKEKADK